MNADHSSVYGPLYELRQIWMKLNEKKADILQCYENNDITHQVRTETMARKTSCARDKTFYS